MTLKKKKKMEEIAAHWDGIRVSKYSIGSSVSKTGCCVKYIY